MSDNVSSIYSSSKNYASALNEKFDQKRYERQQNSDISVVQTVEEVNLEDLQNSINYDNVSQEELTTSFVDILQDNVAADAYSASMQEWTNVSDSNVGYWTDNPLRLTLHEGSGAYLIEQQDASGNWVAMGYTDANTAQAYLEKINLSSNNNGSNYSDDVLAFKEEQMTGQNPTEDISSSSNADSLSYDVNGDGHTDAVDALQMMQEGNTEGAAAILNDAAQFDNSSNNQTNNNVDPLVHYDFEQASVAFDDNSFSNQTSDSITQTIDTTLGDSSLNFQTSSSSNNEEVYNPIVFPTRSDMDGNGVFDMNELDIDLDGNGKADYKDRVARLDLDGNGIADSEEMINELNEFNNHIIN